MDKVYTVREAVKLLKLHENTIRRMIKDGRLKFVRGGKKKILIPDWAIDEFLQKPKD